MVLPGEEEMEEDIWTVRRRRHLSPCRTSLRTGRAGRSGGIFQRRWSQCPGIAKGVLPALGSPSGFISEDPRDWGSSWLSLTDSVEPAPGEAREGSPHHNPTAQQIVQLLPLTQDSPGAPRLGQQPLHAILFTVPRSGR
uniref:uncharacterized protein LOC106999263 isoform X1 n=1 Tax=Macaca mulatta TaxID=9544 RepID=UPI0010A22BA6|nr:uncharacterized protein LOC106999263 isoform X1 [Macaca mulatta]